MPTKLRDKKTVSCRSTFVSYQTCTYIITNKCTRKVHQRLFVRVRSANGTIAHAVVNPGNLCHCICFGLRIGHHFILLIPQQKKQKQLWSTYLQQSRRYGRQNLYPRLYLPHTLHFTKLKLNILGCLKMHAFSLTLTSTAWKTSSCHVDAVNGLGERLNTSRRCTPLRQIRSCSTTPIISVSLTSTLTFTNTYLQQNTLSNSCYRR